MTTVLTSAKPVVENLELSKIVVDPTKNFRTTRDDDALKELANTMKEDGQLQAVGVTANNNGTFNLLYGFRRVEAAKILGWSTIKAEVLQDMTPLQARLNNLAENMARENLNTYDQAMAFHSLKTNDKLSGNEIGKKVGKGTSYINNLCRIVESCEPIILERWKMEQNPSFGRDKDGKKLPTIHQVCTTDWLVKLTTVPRADQENHLKAALGLMPENTDDSGKDEGNGDGRGRSDTTSVRRATMSALNKAITHIKGLKAATKEPEQKKECDLILAALGFAAGTSDKIKVGKVLWWHADLEVKDEKEEKKEGK